MQDIAAVLTREFNLKAFQVNNTIKLIDEGNTIPFIARYRKEVTGELNDQVLRELHERLIYLRTLEERRQDVKRIIEEQGKLTDELSHQIDQAQSLQELEDIYRPYKPKRRTRASIARERGLEPLAIILFNQEPQKQSIDQIAEGFINSEFDVNTIQDALNGAMDIIAENISDEAELRKLLREMFYRHGMIETEAIKDEDSVYKMYNEYKEPVSRIVGHRILAINRGEKEEFLRVEITMPEEQVVDFIKARNIKKPRVEASKYVELACQDAWKRLIYPSVEREVRNELTETAEEKAMKVFAQNLKQLLLQPPIKDRVVLGLDPGFRTGCKLAVVDDTGKVLMTGVIYPTPPQNKIEEAGKLVKALIDKFKIDIISIGNGTASRETENFVVELLKTISKKVFYIVVSEAGASVYSASKLAAEEFPEFDVALRSAVSIARRLQDPLAELVKIDPKAIGVGQYQHDMNQKRLGESLTGVVEDCVNSVGVDLNTASAPLLSYISGINSTVAKNIVEFREVNGKFNSRNELKKVKKLGDKAFEQCAGFLRIPDAKNILDNTSVHPESYPAAQKLLKEMNFELLDVKQKKLEDLEKRVQQKGINNIAEYLGLGVPTLKDIINELQKPGRDPRDELPKPIFRSDILEMEDLKPGMKLTGTVRNVADFGAFVDIGVHQDGLVHISELADKFVKNPMDVVSVGDIVSVKVLDVDVKRKRISLSMKS
jgi:uncharacterized protein